MLLWDKLGKMNSFSGVSYGFSLDFIKIFLNALVFIELLISFMYMYFNIMNIKSSQVLVEEAKKNIETLSSEQVKELNDKNEITLIDIRDIRELWKDGTIENAKHIPRGMLEFWLDPSSSYYNSNKIEGKNKTPSLYSAPFVSAL